MRHDSRHVSASGETANGNAVRFDVQFRRCLASLLSFKLAFALLEAIEAASYPLHDLPRIVNGGWEKIFGRHAVIHVDDFDVDIVADTATPRRFAFQTTQHPSAAVVVDVYWERSFSFWCV